MLSTHRLAAACAAFVSLTPAAAVAGGFEIPDNGTRALGRSGAFAAKADDPTAIYYNPSGLVRLDKPTLLVDLNLVSSDYSFRRAVVERTDRDGRALRVPTTGEFEPVENSAGPFPGPFLAYGHPINDQFAVGIGIYGPSAYGKRQFPADGAQRYNLISSDILLTYSTVSAAYELLDGQLKVGVSLQATTVPRLKVSVKSDGDPKGFLFANSYLQEEDARWDNTINLDVSKGFVPTGVLGVTYSPRRWLDLAVSYRPQVSIAATGTMDVEFSKFFLYDAAGGDPNATDYNRANEEQCRGASAEDRGACSRAPRLTDDGVTLNLDLAPVLRTAARYVHYEGDQELFDVEIDIVREWWSVVDSIDLEFDGQLTFLPFVGAPEGVRQSVNLRERPVHLERRWNDTWSFRFGSDIYLGAWTIRAGMSYETPTFPEGGPDLLTEGLERVTGSFGASFTINDRWRLSAGYLHAFHRPFTASNSHVRSIIPLSECDPPYTDDSACPYEGEPTGNPVGDGRYEASVNIFSLGIQAAL